MTHVPSLVQKRQPAVCNTIPPHPIFPVKNRRPTETGSRHPGEDWRRKDFWSRTAKEFGLIGKRKKPGKNSIPAGAKNKRVNFILKI
jgi:hypothetical protein